MVSQYRFPLTLNQVVMGSSPIALTTDSHGKNDRHDRKVLSPRVLTAVRLGHGRSVAAADLFFIAGVARHAGATRAHHRAILVPRLSKAFSPITARLYPVDATAAIAARSAASCRFDDCKTQAARHKLKARSHKRFVFLSLRFAYSICAAPQQSDLLQNFNVPATTVSPKGRALATMHV
jgi:hypothetical protein